MLYWLGLFGKGLAGLLLMCALVACAQMYRNSGSQVLPVRDTAALRVATYNVHYIWMGRETGPWSRGDWERRKGPLDAAVKALDADLIAFQEMESFAGRSESGVNLTLDHLLAENPDLRAAAVGDPAEFPSTQPILYREARLALLEQGWFFFSETPDVIYARTFNGSFPAFASWAEFRDRQSGAVFRVVNIHTDFASQSNRFKSVELVAARIGPWVEAGMPVLVVGDMNARLGSRTLGILEAAGVTFAPVEGATYHFNRGLNLFAAIDHVGWSGAVTLVGRPVVLRERFFGEWPTDHYPVVVDLRF